ncbi:DUF4325 domain-containing protein [Patescibacteria group bacterium]
MRIEIKKFGTTLTSRQLGKEALSAFMPSLNEIPKKEMIEVDFDGVVTLAPSWADEFLTPILKTYKNVQLENTKNSSVQATLALLKKIYGADFKTLLKYLLTKN